MKRRKLERTYEKLLWERHSNKLLLEDLKKAKFRIGELESENHELSHELKSVKNTIDNMKGYSKDVRREEMYNNLKSQIKALQDKAKALRYDKAKLIEELIKIRKNERTTNN